MGKHDIRIATTSEEYLQNKIKDLEKRLTFAAENNTKLIESNNRLQRYASEIEANAQEKLEEKDARIRNLERAMSRMAEEIYGI